MKELNYGRLLRACVCCKRTRVASLTRQNIQEIRENIEWQVCGKSYWMARRVYARVLRLKTKQKAAYQPNPPTYIGITVAVTMRLPCLFCSLSIYKFIESNVLFNSKELIGSET